VTIEATLETLRDQIVAARAGGRALLIRGGGTRLFYGEPLPDDAHHAWLHLSGYAGIVSYEPAELVLTARAGTRLAEVEHTLASHGQMLAFEPPRFGAADTIGGCIATGLSGPRRMSAGAAPDFVLGTRLLDAAGEVLHFGGEVMKNVAGFDVSRLLAGSLGILGALLEVSLKVVPLPRCEATRVLELDEAAALRQCQVWRARPWPVSATAWLPGPNPAAGRLWVRLSGNESAVTGARREIGGDPAAADAAAGFWASLRDQTHAAFGARPLWRVVLPPKAGRLAATGTPLLHEWGGTLRWLAGPQDAASLRRQVAALGGAACLYRRGDDDATTPTFQPLSPAVARIHQRLKQQFDPAGVFNPGRLVRGI
jgi:glycolate oxidase FAD binding subunit